MDDTPVIHIGDRAAGPGQPVYVIAEVSANHLGDYERAAAIVRAAAAAGADAVKLQTYTPGAMTLDCDAPPFRIEGGTAWDGQTEYALYKEAATPWEWHAPLRDLARELGLDFLSTAYDPTAVDALESLGVPVYKVASFELVDTHLLACIAATGKPVILSTGMATLDEIDDALDAFDEAGGGELALLHCVSAYPAPPEAMNLRTIPNMAARYGVPAGLSDHTIGIEAAVAAVALGACIVEKHLTLARADGGPDGAFSAEPAEFEAMVAAIRIVERALGVPVYGPTEAEKPLVNYRRSLFVVADVQEGEAFTADNVRAIRPGHGLPPKYLKVVLGKHALRSIPRGAPLAADMIADFEVQ